MTDWLMVIITTIYVVATIVICYFNGKSAKAAKLQTEEMIRQYKMSNRPNVKIHFDIIRSGLLCFVLENEGAEPAHNVNVKINDLFINGMKSERERERIHRLSESQLYLASRQKIFILLGGQTQFSKLAQNVAEIDISYDEYCEHTSIDLNQYGMFLVYNSPSEDISQHLKKIQENEDRFHKNLLKQLSKDCPIRNIVVHNATEDEANKYKIYKSICCEGEHTTIQIAENMKLDKDYVLELLIELAKVDRLIGYYEGLEENDDLVVWYRL
jgi:hypothetical protein